MTEPLKSPSPSKLKRQAAALKRWALEQMANAEAGSTYRILPSSQRKPLLWARAKAIYEKLVTEQDEKLPFQQSDDDWAGTRPPITGSTSAATSPAPPWAI